MSFSTGRVVAVLLLPVVLHGRTAGAPQHERALEYGMNPSFATWSSRAIVFADAMARPREHVLYDGGSLGVAPAIPLGQGLLGEGWPDPSALGPGQSFGALLFGSMQGTIPDGTVEPYVIVWQGTGSCWLMGQHVTGEANRTGQRVEVFVDPSQGSPNATLSCHWDGPDPLDPVRDVHVYLPGMEGAAELFWPPYVEKARGINAGAGPVSWRTLDWSRVNEYGVQPVHGGFTFDLAGVIHPSSPSQGTFRGMCVEFMVAFCNALGADLHLTLPHRTDDLTDTEYESFLTDALTRVRDGSPGVPGVQGGLPFAGLHPELTVTVELSNEIWNAGFPVHAWMIQQAQANGVSDHQQVANEIARLFSVADQVFAGPNAPRLRTYVGGRLSNAAYVAGVLNALPAGTHVDAAGSAAYFRPRQQDIAAWLAGASGSDCPNCPTPEEVVASARLSIPAVGAQLEANRAAVEAYTNPDGSHPRFVLYEAGSNLHAGFQPWAGAANQANQLPEMFAAYVDDLVPELVDHGAELVHWYSFMTDFTPSGFAAYGCWNDMEQEITLPVTTPYVDDGAPKAAAIYRGPPLTLQAPAAQSVFRNAGSNPASLSVDPPVLGTIVTASVDLTTSGHGFAALLFSPGQATIPFTGGLYLLTFVPGTTLGVVPPRPGPLATFAFPVPNDVSYCGRELSVQAVHAGGLPQVALSNAQDLLFGR